MYEAVKEWLIAYFNTRRKVGCSCHLESTTPNKPFSNHVRCLFSDELLFLLKIEGFYPDLIGYVEVSGESRHRIMTVEVKGEKAKLKDIFQAKEYGEIFQADYALLISSQPLPIEIKKILEKRPDLLSYSAGYRTLKVAELELDQKKSILAMNWVTPPPSV